MYIYYLVAIYAIYTDFNVKGNIVLTFLEKETLYNCLKLLKIIFRFTIKFIIWQMFDKHAGLSHSFVNRKLSKNIGNCF